MNHFEDNNISLRGSLLLPHTVYISEIELALGAEGASVRAFGDVSTNCILINSRVTPHAPKVSYLQVFRFTMPRLITCATLK